MQRVTIAPKISDKAKEKFDKILLKEHRSQAQQIEYWIENYKFEDKEEN